MKKILVALTILLSAPCFAWGEDSFVYLDFKLASALSSNDDYDGYQHDVFGAGFAGGVVIPLNDWFNFRGELAYEFGVLDSGGLSEQKWILYPMFRVGLEMHYKEFPVIPYALIGGMPHIEGVFEYPGWDATVGIRLPVFGDEGSVSFGMVYGQLYPEDPGDDVKKHMGFISLSHSF